MLPQPLQLLLNASNQWRSLTILPRMIVIRQPLPPQFQRSSSEKVQRGTQLCRLLNGEAEGGEERLQAVESVLWVHYIISLLIMSSRPIQSKPSPLHLSIVIYSLRFNGRDLLMDVVYDEEVFTNRYNIFDLSPSCSKYRGYCLFADSMELQNILRSIRLQHRSVQLFNTR